MQLSQSDLEEFKQIYKAETGLEITDAEAVELGNRLLGLVKFVLSDDRPP